MFTAFTNQYQLSKTLRFELRPIGKTLANIEQKGLLTQDKERSDEYKIVKEIIDRYHKHFIGEALHGLALGGIERYEELYFKAKKDDKEQKEFDDLRNSMRKEIAKQFTKHPKWGTLFSKELIKIELPSSGIIKDASELAILDNFKDFTTYFSGFHDNRANMYSSDDKHSAIAYRIVHENLPIFLANKRLFEKISKEYLELITDTKTEIEPHLLGAVFEDVFTNAHFSFTMSQVHIELYNTILGGNVLEDGTKIQGFNEKINLFRQQRGIDKKQLPNLKQLHKQILSDRESLSWLPEAFDDDAQMIEGVRKFYDKHILHFECCDGKVNIIDKLRELFSQQSSCDKSKIFVKNDRSITDISQAIFGDYSVIKSALWNKHLADNPKAQKSKDINADEEKFFSKKNSYFAVSHIEEALRLYLANDEKHGGKLSANTVMDYFKSFQVTSESDKTAKTSLLAGISESYEAWSANTGNKELIKSFLDSLLNLQRYLKPLNVQTDSEKDIVFYSQFDTYFAPLGEVVRLYDKVRNHLTKKPYSLEKFKLNFENSTLLNGWDVNKEPDNTAILFRKDGLYYLGIMDKKHNKIMEKYKPQDANVSGYQKIEYKLLPGANKMLPKVFFSKSRISEFNPSDELLQNYENETHKKGEKFNLAHCHQLIDFFKASIQKHEDWKHFGFRFSDTSTYSDLSGFYREVEQQGYKITYRAISSDYIDELIESGKLHLFQIYNKDFSPYSKGAPNMHTLYWKMLFDEDNLRNVVYKLNGQAEIFYRKKSIDYSEEILQKGHHHEALKGKFAYPIIKDRRFSMDKFQFHVPITLNFKATGNDNINHTTNEFIQKNHSDIKVIGIDRGERHLLYISMIDENGKIILQESLNKILNTHSGAPIDYHEKLVKKEKERADARVNWGTVEAIKELKDGYMSQVIHKIATLMVEHNAIVALEDLNFGFKQGRFKVI